jgi:hypothetical protein
MLAAVDEPFTKVSSNLSTLDAISGVDLGERVVYLVEVFRELLGRTVKASDGNCGREAVR